MSRIAGIDVGGTFTDLILVDDATATVRLAKVPTTVENQAWGVLAALDSSNPKAAHALVTDLLSIAGISTVGGRTVGEIADAMRAVFGEYKEVASL